MGPIQYHSYDNGHPSGWWVEPAVLGVVASPAVEAVGRASPVAVAAARANLVDAVAAVEVVVAVVAMAGVEGAAEPMPVPVPVVAGLAFHAVPRGDERAQLVLAAQRFFLRQAKR